MSHPVSMNNVIKLVFLLTFFPSLVSAQEPGSNPEALKQQVVSTERSFARTMADRDFTAFAQFIDDEAVFFSAEEPSRGKARVLAVWKSYFEGPDAPFSWEPEHAEVLESGTLAFSSGPVYGPDGRRVATFHSVWRRGTNGEWKIVFDKGSRFCE